MTTAFLEAGGQAQDAERREEERWRVLRGGSLTFNRGYGAFDCIVRNMSLHGARLGFGEAFAVPAAFDLKVYGEVRPAVVRWRSASDVGVSLGEAR